MNNAASGKTLALKGVVFADVMRQPRLSRVGLNNERYGPQRSRMNGAATLRQRKTYDTD